MPIIWGAGKWARTEASCQLKDSDELELPAQRLESKEPIKFLRELNCQRKWQSPNMTYKKHDAKTMTLLGRHQPHHHSDVNKAVARTDTPKPRTEGCHLVWLRTLLYHQTSNPQQCLNICRYYWLMTTEGVSHSPLLKMENCTSGNAYCRYLGFFLALLPMSMVVNFRI